MNISHLLLNLNIILILNKINISIIDKNNFEIQALY